MNKQKITVVALISACCISPLAQATNGMLMEGYGPIATSMGGASMAYDNGNAGMANNPATLGLMADGSRLDIAAGGLHPNITSKMSGQADAKSAGDAYFMPAAGWVTKHNGLAYGVGVFALGGMGTEYKSSDWVSAGAGQASRSEVGVGNLIFPVSFDLSPDLTIAGSVDLVWSGMDLQMAMNSTQMSALESAGNFKATMGGGAFTVAGMTGMGYNVARFDFSDDSAFTGKAKSTGYAAKVGVTFKVNRELTVGASYHSKTALGDMKASDAKVSMIDSTGVNPTQTMTGEISIVDFQFPEVYGVGVAYQADEATMLVADWKHIGWKDAMKGFHMTYTSAGIGMGAVTMDVTMPQDWKDQDVVALGVAYKTTRELTLRAGVNLASNPVPNETVNPLFPATVTNSSTFGAGYAIDKASAVNASLTIVPKSTVQSPSGYSIEHSQTNWQVMYSRAM